MKKTIPIAVVMLLLLAPFYAVNAHCAETGFLDRSVTLNGKEYLYQVYLPRDYDNSVSWPVTLFLHGAGERGNDGLNQTRVGLGNAIRRNPERWPTIAVFPQVPSAESWLDLNGPMAIAALDATIEEFSTDEDRQYLTGLSLGGNGAWYVGYNYPDRFAAIVPICGFVALRDDRSFVPGNANPYAAIADVLAGKPVWIFHGAADSVVPVTESQKMAEELSKGDADFHYTEYPGVNHNSWDRAYGDEEMIAWLFSQRLE